MIELGGGLFIETREDIKIQQEDWADCDSCKEMNFDAYPFWLTTDDGQIPEGFNSVNEVIQELTEKDCLTEEQLDKLNKYML